ncbi:MAG: replication protein, partial [Halochromatium sp.]
MASPQCENGHVRIADELFDEILKADFAKRELLVVLAVIRKTYGYRKTMDRISSSQLAELTGMDGSHCRKTLRNLKKRGILLEDHGRIGVQKDYTRWAGPKRPGPKRPGKPGQNGPENRANLAHTTNI